MYISFFKVKAEIFIIRQVILQGTMPVISTRVQSTKTCKPKNSWLVGKVKCGNCGYALTIRRAKTKWERYFVCSQSGNHGNCKGAGCTIYADVLEEYMLGAIKKRLSEFQKLSCITDTGEVQKNMTKKIRLTQIEEEIEELLSKVFGASGVLMKYIDEKVSKHGKRSLSRADRR